MPVDFALYAVQVTFNLCVVTSILFAVNLDQRD